MTGTGPEDDTETVQVVTRDARTDHLAAQQARPKVMAHSEPVRSVDQLVDIGGDEAFVQYAFDAHGPTQGKMDG